MLFLNDTSAYDIGDVFVNMMLGYNLVLHFPAVFVNTAIITKEITMEFF